ncbi:HAD family hydrolase [Tichowtungia aerotolerans]|uniref:phosphoglycolate phosphatase n=1 Tax=Tichowtungia aerotolerans TaxID=2697043 RepID=A0A6P1M228_9BACT|nr:HAD hydrolase-like protein [Tichowtungia aerotolerans]QHI68879.1 HAD hydrolase-like protein [Tichowtungia aerotolerans]
MAAKHDILLAIDSDGCVFDSMTVKQGIFHTGIIEFWGMEAAADEARKLCEWVGLYSPWRGLNRFQLILKIFQTLDEFLPNIGKPLPTESLEVFIDSGATLSMQELEKWIEKTGATELQAVLEWSREMSRRIAEVAVFPVFDGVFQGLKKLHTAADLIVVSQTTEDALVREWNHAGLTGFVDVIAGAELGSKKESLETVMKGRYGPEQAVMVGDATGDLDAARAAGCLFYPIIPGDEVRSWAELRSEGLARILNGTFAGAYQEALIARFNGVLSDVPPRTH